MLRYLKEKQQLRNKIKVPVQKMIFAVFFINFLKASLVSCLGCFLQQSEADRLRRKSPLVNDGSLGGMAGWMPRVSEDVWSMFLRSSWENVFHFNPLESAKHEGGQTATLNLTLWHHPCGYWLIQSAHTNAIFITEGTPLNIRKIQLNETE